MLGRRSAVLEGGCSAVLEGGCSAVPSGGSFESCPCNCFVVTTGGRGRL